MDACLVVEIGRTPVVAKMPRGWRGEFDAVMSGYAVEGRWRALAGQMVGPEAAERSL